MTPKTQIRLLLALVAVLLFLNASHTFVKAAVGADGRAAAPDVSVNREVPGGPGFIMISPVQFRPLFADTAFAYNPYTLYNPGAVLGMYAVGLNLPDNATIKKVVVYFLDSSAASGLEITLVRSQADTGASNLMSVLVSSGSDGGYRDMEDTTINNAVVDNQNYAYVVEVDIPGGAGQNLILNAVRIDYEFGSTFFPVIMK